MKKNMILMSILAAALLAGCNDNDDDAIADGTLSCSVNASGQEFVIVRENGSWKQKEECKGSCNDGACLSTHLTCTSSESKCVKDALDLGDDSSIVEKANFQGELSFLEPMFKQENQSLALRGFARYFGSYQVPLAIEKRFGAEATIARRFKTYKNLEPSSFKSKN
jgi:hypothetical protein